MKLEAFDDDEKDEYKPRKLILPKYILNKPKTGWSVPITAWLVQQENIKKKYIETCSKQDGINEILSKDNYAGNQKRMIITWMLRSWAQQYNMTL